MREGVAERKVDEKGRQDVTVYQDSIRGMNASALSVKRIVLKNMYSLLNVILSAKL